MKNLDNKTKRHRRCELRTVLLTALAFDKRVEILEVLRDVELSEQEIACELGLSQAGTSRHLRCLREAGLVSVRQEGIRRFYSLHDPRILGLLADTDELLRAIWRMEKEEKDNG